MIPDSPNRAARPALDFLTIRGSTLSLLATTILFAVLIHTACSLLDAVHLRLFRLVPFATRFRFC